ncbi:hypothetical protein B566_EDAN006097 [Ephemera danica]|nr:hypothetical protein B566_EDAN006097 [Ephemera danica]
MVNPQSSTYQGEWPWHVAIYSTASGNQRYICGGTLISRRVIITAAHCATNENTRREWSPEELVVYLGKHSLPRGWSVSNGVQIDAEITSYVRLICLWPQQEKDIRTLKGQLGTVVGWGIDSTYQRSLQLTRVDLPVRSYEECVRSNRDFFSRYLVDKTGGGMVFQINNRWFLRGLVSTAVKLSDKIRVCNPEHYTVFVDVAQYRDWIEDNQPENVN